MSKAIFLDLANSQQTRMALNQWRVSLRIQEMEGRQRQGALSDLDGHDVCRQWSTVRVKNRKELELAARFVPLLGFLQVAE